MGSQTAPERDLDTLLSNTIGPPMDQDGIGQKAGPIEAALRARIATGAWLVGSRLPSERQLAQEFGVARNTVRRAVASLAGDGLVAAAVGRGTFVADAAPPSLIQALRAAGRPVAPADAAEVRLMIEPAAAALAATRAAPDDYAVIEAALAASLQARGFEAFEAADAHLHGAIISACRNGFLADLYRVVLATRDEPRWAALKRRAASPERRALYDRQHSAIVAALRARDVDAAHLAMRSHLRSVQTSLSETCPVPL